MGHALILFSLIGIALACRVIPVWSLVFGHAGEVRLFEADPWFHERQARFVAHHFPAIDRWDIAVNFPYGERGFNQGLFDLFNGTLALVAGAGHPSDLLVAQVCAWIPLLFSVFIFLALYDLARRLLGPSGALLALGLLVAVPSAFVNYSLLGFSDHHVAEILLAVLTCRCLLSCVEEGLQPPAEVARAKAPWWEPDIIRAAPLVAFLFTWPGAAMYLLLALLSLLAVATARLAQGLACRPLAGIAFRYGLGVAVPYITLSLAFPDLVMWWEAHHMILLGTAVMVFALPLLFVCLDSIRAPFADNRPRWPAATLLLVMVAIAVAILMSPRGINVIAMVLSPHSPLISEQQPVTFSLFFNLYGLLGICALLEIPILTFTVLRARSPITWMLPLTWAIGLLIFWTATNDFVYAPPPWMALLCASFVLRVSMPRLSDKVVRTALVVCLLLPPALQWTARPWMPAGSLNKLMSINDDWVAALHWLRDGTPPLPLPIDSRVAPFDNDKGFDYPAGSYGVMSSWDYGHWIATLGARPAVVSGTLSPTGVEWLLLRDETEAWLRLRQRPSTPVRYVMVDAPMVAEFFITETTAVDTKLLQFVAQGPPTPWDPMSHLPIYGATYRKAMECRLYLGDADALSHFRLVYESPGRSIVAYVAERTGTQLQVMRRSFHEDVNQESARLRQVVDNGQVLAGPHVTVYGGERASTVKVFEQVVGARLEGTVPPRARVEARLTLVCSVTGRTFVYHHASTADARGHFSLIVPYPTDVLQWSTVRARDKYVVTAQGQSRTVAVKESDVAQGLPVNVGAF